MITTDVTTLLRSWNRGNPAALDALMPLVHQELKRLARRHLRHERGDHTIQPTALVNEAYLRLVAENRIDWQNRDCALEDHVARLSLVRARRRAWFARFPDTVEWRTLEGRPKTVADWEDPHSAGFVYEAREEEVGIRVEVRRREREVRIVAL